MELPPGLQHVLAETHLFTDARLYVILSLPATARAEAMEVMAENPEPFTTVVCDKDEVTLVLPVDIWEEARPTLKALAESSEYRLITFDLPLDLGLVGYLAVVTATLAEAGVSIFSISAFSRDHVLIPADDFDVAWDALRALIRSCKPESSASV